MGYQSSERYYAGEEEYYTPEYSSSMRGIEEILYWFTNHMRGKLMRNMHKQSWRYSDIGYLRRRLDQELKELDEAIASGDEKSISSECGDCSNFLMMIHDLSEISISNKSKQGREE
jgi:NTP pyrophosphatase (non-canonical NTP hydrolase)